MIYADVRPRSLSASGDVDPSTLIGAFSPRPDPTQVPITQTASPATKTKTLPLSITERGTASEYVSSRHSSRTVTRLRAESISTVFDKKISEQASTTACQTQTTEKVDQPTINPEVPLNNGPEQETQIPPSHDPYELYDLSMNIYNADAAEVLFSPKPLQTDLPNTPDTSLNKINIGQKETQPQTEISDHRTQINSNPQFIHTESSERPKPKSGYSSVQTQQMQSPSQKKCSNCSCLIM